MSDRQIDQQLVTRAQNGDKRAFDLLVSKYQRRLGRLLSRFLKDSADIDDVVQDAFIKAYRALPSFRGESAFYTWLYRIAINCGKNFLSKNNRKEIYCIGQNEKGEILDAAEQVPDLNTPETALMNKQIVETVNLVTDRLPDELKTAIILREMEGLSYEEIAEIMDCPIGTVRSRIFRAREAIATELKPLLESKNSKRW